MKIAFMHHTFMEGSGIDSVIFELATRLAKQHEVAVFTFNNEYGDALPFIIKELPIPFKRNRISCSVISPIYLSSVMEVRRLIRQYDVVNTHLYPCNIIPLLPNKVKNTLHIVTEWGTQSPQSFNRWSEKTYLKFLLKANDYADKHADVVIAGNKETQSQLLRKGILAHRMYLYGVNFDYLDRNVSPEPIYKQYPVLRHKKVILYVGRHSPHKNIHILIKSFKIVKQSIPDAKLVIVGRHSFPDYSKELEIMAITLGLEKDVIFAGFVPRDKVPMYYALCDIFTVCAAWEGFLIPEPLGMGKPMVAYDATPHRETIRHGVNGLLVGELTPEAFAEAQVELLADADRRKAMGEAGYRWAKQHLDYDVIANKFSLFINDELRRRP